MESSYGIGVKNRYELFYDDESDPLDAPKKSRVKKKKDKTAEKENKVEKTPEKSEPVKIEQKANGDISSNEKKEIEKKPSNERVRFGDKEERNNRTNEYNKDNGPSRFSGERRERSERGGRFNGTTEFSRGRGGGRGRGRGNWNENRGKREFDRQSGMNNSGVKAFDKRNGGGSYNWGSDIKNMNEAEDSPQNDGDFSDNDKKEDGKPNRKSPNNFGDEWNEKKDDDWAGDASPKEEEAPKEMTLDEWKASQKRSKPEYNIRKAGEGENKAQWKKTYVLKKKEKEEEPETEEMIPEEKESKKRAPKPIPIDFQFSDPPTRGRFGRGRGRGGPPSRGGRGRGRGGGGGRYPPVRQEAPRMDDEKDFPSLG